MHERRWLQKRLRPLSLAGCLIAACAVPVWVYPAEVKHAAIQVISPEQFGAAGDGVRDDTDAFGAAAEKIRSNGGGTLRLTQGKTYRVGRQYHVEGLYAYYQTSPMFSLVNKGKTKKAGLCVVIEGNGATVKLNDGLRVGSFGKDNGTVYNPTLPFTDRKYRANPGNVFAFTGCASVEIRNMTIDGNISHMIVGGEWGDKGRQCTASGIYLSSCDRIRVDNVISSHCGLDGITLVDWQGSSSNQDWIVSSSRFEYNARQGMSWCGGQGLTVTNCKFNHTGRESFSSAPGAGLDIEAESSAIRSGLFVSCDFVNNVGCGMVADSGNSADVAFSNCLFWGTSNWSIWPNKPKLHFYNCRIYGSLVNPYGSPNPEMATQFYNCHFEDYEGLYGGNTYTSLRASKGLLDPHRDNFLLDGCTVVANKCVAMSMVQGRSKIVRNCKIYHKWGDAPKDSALSALADVRVENTHFYEDLGNTGRRFYIRNWPYAPAIIGPGVYVDGPQCTWERIDGRTGLITNTNSVTAFTVCPHSSWGTPITATSATIYSFT